jgi:serine protease Do
MAVLVLLPLALAAQSAGQQTAATASAPADNALLALNLDDTPLDRSNRERLTSYADVLDKVMPAVVSVYTERRVTLSRRHSDESLEDLLRREYGMTPDNSSPSQTGPERTVPYGAASGSIVTSDGYILTNRHVVMGPRDRPADTIYVKLHDGREFAARYIGSDEDTDIALLKIDAQNLPTLKLANSDNLKVGDIVFAVGNPMELGFTVTQGIVSATGRSDLSLLGDDGVEDFIQTDAPINPGNSGGPLVDAEGRQVGLDSAILSTSNDGGSIGIGFAIPTSLANHVVHDLVVYGKLRRGYLGVGIQDIDRDMAQGLGLNTTEGALIQDADPNLPAGRAGVQHGDVVLQLNDEQIDSAAKLRFAVARCEPGTEVTLKVLRDGQPRLVKVVLGDHDALTGGSGSDSPLTSPAVPPPAAAADGPLAGVTLAAMSPVLRQKFNLPANVTGVVVTAVDDSSTYADEFAPGMVLIEVNQQPVAAVDDVRAQLKPGAVNIFYAYHDGKFPFLTAELPRE